MKAERSDFVSDIQEIRRRARQHIEEGAVTKSYRGDRTTVLKILNEALATELVCVLRYKRHQFMAAGLASSTVAAEFAAHADEEAAHADMIAERITQLGGEPDYNPAILAGRAHSEYKEGKDLVDMIREDLIAERIAIESYTEIIRYLDKDDPTSRRVMEEILAKEEEHANDMVDLLGRVQHDARTR